MRSSNFVTYGIIPKNHPAEIAQFERVIGILKSNAHIIGPWVVCVLDIPIIHKAGNRIDSDTDWRGQIDMLIISRNKIVLYELKGFTAQILYGKTDNREWKIRRWRSRRPELVPSFFQQASKNRAYILQDFLENYRNTHDRLENQHFVVDARVVLKEESNLNGFFYRIPRTIEEEVFYNEILPRIYDTEDRNLMQKLYSGIEVETGKLHTVKLDKEEYKQSQDIFRKYNIPIRTDKWFRLLTEKDIVLDLYGTGSDRFIIEQEKAFDMAECFLNNSRELCD